MARPLQQIRIYALQNRRGDGRLKLAHIGRWSIDGRQKSRSFRTKAEADRFRVELLKAAEGGDRFDPDTGEPSSWVQPLADLGVHQWVRRWLAEEWPEWQPRTRASASEALARFTALAVKPGVEAPGEVRRYLANALAPDAVHQLEQERGLERNRLALGDLDRDAVRRSLVSSA